MISKAMQEAAGLILLPASKMALRIVDDLEGRLAVTPWCSGVLLGSEHELALRHGVAPLTMRQALRVLQSQQLGYTRPGNAGGFILSRPPSSATARLMALHLSALGIGADDARRAQQLMLATLPADSPAAVFAAQLLADLQEALVPRNSAASLAHGGRALDIALRIIADHRCSDRIGTVDSLSERHHAGAPIIVQAVRILEQLELVTLLRGRSGGLVRREPTAGAIVKAISPHLRAQGLDSGMCGQLIFAANEISARLASRRNEARLHLHYLRTSIAVVQTSEQVRSGQVATFKHLADMACEPVLHLITRCLFFYKELYEAKVDTRPELLKNRERGATLAVIDAVMGGREEDAAAAVAACVVER